MTVFVRNGLFILLTSMQALNLWTPLKAQDKIDLKRPKVQVTFTLPGPLEEEAVESYFFDTTFYYYGGNWEIRLDESNTVHTKRANINYESRVMEAVCGEGWAYRESDFTKWMTGATGKTTKNPLKVSGYNACLSMGEMYPPPGQGEATFSFTLIVPFYTLSGNGPAAMKEELLRTLRSFALVVLDPKLEEPSDRPVPKRTIAMLKQLIEEPFENIVDTDVVMSKGDEENVEDIMNPMCKPSSIVTASPPISMGYTGKTSFTIRRDEIVPLSARAEDIDLIHLFCQSQPSCGDDGGSWLRTMFRPVDLIWKIRSGAARFAQVGHLPANGRSARGENVILRPPTMVNPGEKKTTVIRITAKDKGNTHLDSDSYTDIIVHFESRAKGDKGGIEIGVSIEPGEKVFKPYRDGDPINEQAACSFEHELQEIAQLPKPVLKLPRVADAQTLAFGEHIQLQVSPQTDLDRVQYGCKSTCGESEKMDLDLHEELVYEWEVNGGGLFIVNGEATTRATGKAVIFRAGLDQTKANISVRATNRKGDFADAASPKATVRLDIFRPAIQIDPLPTNWVPGFDSLLKLTTRLVLFSPGNTAPRPAPAHLTAAYSLRLGGISNYFGICSNFDLSDNREDNKWDLYFERNEGNLDHQYFHFDDQDNQRSGYIRKIPLLSGGRRHTTEIHVRDYGAHAEVYIEGISVNFLDPDQIGLNPFTIPLRASAENRFASHLPHSNFAPDYDQDDRDRYAAGFQDNAGDGLLNWEEYRGFMICPDPTACQSDSWEHVRSHPDDRDLFIWTEEASNHFALFETAADVAVHFVSEGLFNRGRVINFKNQVAWGGPQIVLRVERGVVQGKRNPLTGGYSSPDSTSLGQAQAVSNVEESDGGGFRLQDVEKLVINFDRIAAIGGQANVTIGHEIAHALGVPHHGDIGQADMNCFSVDNPFGTGCITVCFPTPGSVYSGSMTCLMRYPVSIVLEDPDITRTVTLCNTNQIGAGRIMTGYRVLFDEEPGHNLTAIASPVQPLATQRTLCRGTGATSPQQAVAPGRGHCYDRVFIRSW